MILKKDIEMAIWNQSNITKIGFMDILLERISNIILKKKQGTCCRYPAEEKIYRN